MPSASVPSEQIPPPPISTTSSSKKTMFNYFEKLPSKTSIAIDENPRKVAPIFNKQHVDHFQTRIEQFDNELVSQINPAESNSNRNYLSALKTQQHNPFVVLIKPRGSLRARLLQFHEDVRPPYFGTWQKTSRKVTGRRPFGLETEVFDYDVDSEAEWDIGGPGESLKGDDSDDEEELDDYEIDMKTFVPHGYVSDDEIDVASDNEDNQPLNHSIEMKNCDEENSNESIKIVGEVKAIAAPPPLPPTVKQTPKMDIKPIVLGLTYEDNPSISEAKQQFLKTFQGYSCASIITETPS